MDEVGNEWFEDYYQKPTLRQSPKSYNEAASADFSRGAEIVGASVVAGLLITYLGYVKSYHQALEKHDKLSKLLYNPNAKVASGDRAKAILSQA